MISRDYEEFIESLNARRARYLLVGAHAVAFHEVPTQYISLTDLEQTKSASDRLQDRADAESLRKAIARGE